jgi:hypothetical protein
MSPRQRVTVSPIPRLERSSGRALLYLVIDEEERVNAWPVLKRLDTLRHKKVIKERRDVWARFRSWLAGLKNDDYHHGWPDDPDFLMGYAFRWDHQRQHRRLYGFLSHPRPGLEVCVLCCFRSKSRWKTDPEVKKLIRELSADPQVNASIRSVFNTGERTSWTTH